jgi:hypothetical protein
MIEGTYLSVGPAKNGTSSFFKMLSQHPQMYPSKYKDPCFEGYIIYEDYNKFLNLWDFKKIDYSKKHILFSGEVKRDIYLKSDYLKLPNIKKTKYIFILRKFIDNFISLLFHDYILTNKIDVDYYIKKNFFYFDYLKNISKKIGKENIFFIRFDEIESKQSEIYDFLEIDNQYKFTYPFVQSNPGSKEIFKRNLTKHYFNKKCDILLKIFLNELYKIQKEFNIDLDDESLI